MKRLICLSMCVFFVTLAIGCSGHYHKTAMPDPASFNAHFGDMDADGDGLVSREEFNNFFKNPDPKVFDAIDMNKDGAIDHDEWHAFKEAHGMRHHQ
jgi:hypothetical protein